MFKTYITKNQLPYFFKKFEPGVYLNLGIILEIYGKFRNFKGGKCYVVASPEMYNKLMKEYMTSNHMLKDFVVFEF